MASSASSPSHPPEISHHHMEDVREPPKKTAEGLELPRKQLVRSPFWGSFFLGGEVEWVESDGKLSNEKTLVV